jgi:hypothetical protein
VDRYLFENGLVHKDDDIALFVPLFDIVMRLDNLLQPIAPIDDGFEFAGLNQIFEQVYICLVDTGGFTDDFFAAGAGSPLTAHDLSDRDLGAL